ncbi:MAG: hypothetical protein WA192_03365 [Candidatus Acidiferrales bacterium]
MNLRLFQELMELNLAFEHVIHGLQRMEKVKLYHSDIIRYARADVESARVDANREFFDNFDEIVENDAVWAYKFQREYNKKIKDPDEIYLEIKDSEERRKKKGLPPRLVVLPGWDMSDEDAPWTRSRQDQIEADLRAAWSNDPVVLTDGKGTPEMQGKTGQIN